MCLQIYVLYNILLSKIQGNCLFGPIVALINLKIVLCFQEVNGFDTFGDFTKSIYLKHQDMYMVAQLRFYPVGFCYLFVYFRSLIISILLFLFIFLHLQPCFYSSDSLFVLEECKCCLSFQLVRKYIFRGPLIRVAYILFFCDLLTCKEVIVTICSLGSNES